MSAALELALVLLCPVLVPSVALFASDPAGAGWLAALLFGAVLLCGAASPLLAVVVLLLSGELEVELVPEPVPEPVPELALS